MFPPIAAPRLSVLLIIDGQRHRAARCLRSLLNQQIVDDMEILLVDLRAAIAAPLSGSDHARVRRLQPTRGLSFGALQAEASEQARGAVVAFLEEHCVALPGWAEALLCAHAGPAAGIGGARHNPTPTRPLPSFIHFLDDGPWSAPARAVATATLPAGNVAYKRDILVRYRERLALFFQSEGLLHEQLISDGFTLAVEPAAHYLHEYEDSIAELWRRWWWQGYVTGAARAELGAWGRAARREHIEKLLAALSQTRVRLHRLVDRTAPHAKLARANRRAALLFLVCPTLGEIAGTALGGMPLRAPVQHSLLNANRGRPMHSALTDWHQGGTFFNFDRHRIFYRRQGQGEPVLAIHGYPLSSIDWARIWGPLTERYDVIAPDLLGFGFSDKPTTHAYSVFDHAAMLEALLRHLGLSHVHILTHDLGNSVAQELLARTVERNANAPIRSLCFLNGGLFAEAYTPRLIQKVLSSPLGGLIGPRVPRRLFDKAIAEVFGARTQPSRNDLDCFWHILNHNDGRRVTHRVGRFIFERVRYRDRWVRPMQSTTLPMRFINGPADPNSGRPMAERYRQLIPNPDVVLLDAAIGHWPQLEAAGPTSAAILDFLTGRAKATHAA